MPHPKPKPRICPNPNCAHPVNKHNANFCDNCGAKLVEDENLHKYEAPQPVITQRLHTKIFLWKLSSGAIPFLDFQHFRTLQHMILAPGNSLKECVACQKEVQKIVKTRKAITYFILFMAFDLFLNSKILKKPPFNFTNQLLGNLPDVIAPFVLILLMLGIWGIGYLTLGSKWNIGKRKPGAEPVKDYYCARDVFIISLYIYGTNFFLAPVLLFIFFPFRGAADNTLDYMFSLKCPELANISPELMYLNCPELASSENMLTDIPLALFMLYMLFMLVKKTDGYKYLFPRYAAFCVLSISYYRLMYPVVAGLTEYLKGVPYLN